jgi:hypothetical protein
MGATGAPDVDPPDAAAFVTAAKRRFWLTQAADSGDADEVAKIGMGLGAGADGDNGFSGRAAAPAAARTPAATAATITVVCLDFDVARSPCRSSEPAASLRCPIGVPFRIVGLQCPTRALSLVGAPTGRHSDTF